MFQKNSFGNIISVSNSFDPDQDRHSDKLIVMVISRPQKSPLSRKELNLYHVGHIFVICNQVRLKAACLTADTRENVAILYGVYVFIPLFPENY